MYQQADRLELAKIGKKKTNALFNNDEKKDFLIRRNNQSTGNPDNNSVY